MPHPLAPPPLSHSRFPGSRRHTSTPLSQSHSSQVPLSRVTAIRWEAAVSAVAPAPTPLLKKSRSRTESESFFSPLPRQG